MDGKGDEKKEVFCSPTFGMVGFDVDGACSPFLTVHYFGSGSNVWEYKCSSCAANKNATKSC